MNKRLSDDFVRAFKGVAEEAHRVGVAKGWWPGVNQGVMPDQGTMSDRGECGRNDGELIALIHSELSEALEALRHGDPPDEHLNKANAQHPTSNAQRRMKEQFRSAETEMADAIIRIMDMGVARGWRIAEALVAKMAFNETRPHRHGGKRF